MTTKLKKGDKVILKDISLNEPSCYPEDRGAFLEYDNGLVVWESSGGIYKTPKERFWNEELPVIEEIKKL